MSLHSPLPISQVTLPPHIPDHNFFTIAPLGRVLAVVVLFWGVQLISRLFFGLVFDSFRKSTSKTQIVWETSAVALVHALFSSLAGFWIFHNEHGLFYDPVNTWSDLCYFMSPWTMGYILFDSIVVVYYTAQGLMTTLSSNPMIIFHHLYILIGGTLFWVYAPVGWGYECSLMVTELSTVFLHMRYFLWAAGAEMSTAYLLNGFMLLGAFAYRVIISGYFIYWLYHNVSAISQVSSFLGNFLFFGSILLGGLNLYWFWLLCQKALERLMPSKQKPS